MQRCRGQLHRCILLFFGGDKKARDKVKLVRGDAGIVPEVGLAVYLIMAYTAKPRNGQDRSLQLILYCDTNIQMICKAGCPHPAAEKPC